jgi:sugar transferase (PEP-CTERM/EpsH1 system associated)
MEATAAGGDASARRVAFAIDPRLAERAPNRPPRRTKKNAMKLLMLTPRFPYPPRRGDTLRSWGEIVFLSQHHDIWLACIDQKTPRPAHLQHVRHFCRDVTVVPRGRLVALSRGVRSWLNGASLTQGYFSDSALRDIVAGWSRSIRFDAVLTYSSAMGDYAACVGGGRKVLDLVDVDSCKWQRYAERRSFPRNLLYESEAHRLAAYEEHLIDAHDVSLLVNEREKAKLAERADLSRIGVLRTCIDIDRYRASAARSAAGRVTQQPIIGTIASMFYPPNVEGVLWFSRHVWPVIRRAVPNARWLIVGNKPVRKIRRLHNPPHVVVTGFVEDIRPTLHSMRVYVCPIHSDLGVQSKLVVAMAAGKACVVTPQAAEGVDFTNDPPFIVAREAHTFAESVLAVLRDDALACKLGVRAHEVAKRHYQIRDQLALLDQFLRGRQPGDEQYGETALRTMFQPDNAAAGGPDPSTRTDVSPDESELERIST